MARGFSGSSQYLTYSGSPVTNGPLTVSLWFYPNAIDQQKYLFYIGPSSGSGYFSIRVLTDETIEFLWYTSGGIRTATTVNTFSASSWHHALISTSAGGQSMRIILDGGTPATNSGYDLGSLTADLTRVATDGVQSSYFNGREAEIAIWNVVLDTNEESALAKGIQPLLIRPNSLGLYLPLRRDEDEDYIGGRSFTAGGSPTVETHPRIFAVVPWVVAIPVSGAEEQNITGAGNIASLEVLGTSLMKALAKPDGDYSLGDWTDEGAGVSNIYQSVDEVYANDGDYVRSPVSSTTSTYIGTLSNINDPSVHTDHVLFYRYRKQDTASKTVQLVVRLMQGETEIASWTHPDIGTSWIDAEQTLSEAQAANITNYADLRIKFETVEV